MYPEASLTLLPVVVKRWGGGDVEGHGKAESFKLAARAKSSRGCEPEQVTDLNPGGKSQESWDVVCASVPPSLLAISLAS